MTELESSSDLDQAERPRSRMRVRHAYPKPIVDLSNQLLGFFRPREIAAVLDVPLSSIYRWKSKQARSSEPPTKFASSAALRELAERCLRAGIVMSPDIAGMVEMRGATSEPRSVAAKNSASAEFAARLPPVVMKQRLSRRTSARHSSADIADRVERARQLILREYFRDIDAATLAGIAEMSRYHLIRVFNAKYGTSPHQYLTQVRIDAAKALLETSSQTIDVIAVATGFRTGSRLNRTFRRVEGRPPSAYFPILKTRRQG